MKYSYFITIFLFLVVLGVVGNAQTDPTIPVHCPVKDKKKVSYDLISESANTVPPYNLFLTIVVKPDNYNDEYMERLGKTIIERYCKNEEMSVTIFDDKAAARNTDLWAYFLGNVEVPQLRGFFDVLSLGTSTIYYSTKRGNSRKERVLKVPLKS